MRALSSIAVLAKEYALQYAPTISHHLAMPSCLLEAFSAGAKLAQAWPGLDFSDQIMHMIGAAITTGMVSYFMHVIGSAITGGMVFSTLHSLPLTLFGVSCVMSCVYQCSKHSRCDLVLCTPSP